jgi:hypothetical protein
MNPSQKLSRLADRQVLSRELWRPAAKRTSSALVLLALLISVPLRTPAQDDQTNDVNQAQQTEDMTQGTDAAQTDQTMTEGEAAPETDSNATATAPVDSRISGRDARSRRFRRQRGQNQDVSSSSSQSSTNSNPLDYANFKIVADRNIFNPNRYPAYRPPTQERQVDSFNLVGTMSYEKGTFAFFSGSRSQYQKALKLDDTIAGYKVASIGENSVKLAQGTNQIELRMGMQMRREENGPWRASSSLQSYAAAPASNPAAASDSVPTGPNSDVLKRLMKRHEEE